MTPALHTRIHLGLPLLLYQKRCNQIELPLFSRLGSPGNKQGNWLHKYLHEDLEGVCLQFKLQGGFPDHPAITQISIDSYQNGSAKQGHQSPCLSGPGHLLPKQSSDMPKILHGPGTALPAKHNCEATTESLKCQLPPWPHGFVDHLTSSHISNGPVILPSTLAFQAEWMPKV